MAKVRDLGIRLSPDDVARPEIQNCPNTTFPTTNCPNTTFMVPTHMEDEAVQLRQQLQQRIAA